MARYIDATKLLKEFQALPCCPNGYSYEYDKARIFAMIDNQPIADVVERKKGKWIKNEFGSVCGACGLYAYRDKFGRPWESNYCPNCGSDNREEKTDAKIH